MVGDIALRGRRSRRELLQGAGLAGACATLVGACGSSSLRSQIKRAGPATAQADVALLNHLIDVENLSIAAYTAGTPLLAPPAVPAARRLLEQELAHVAGLTGLVKSAGGKAHKPLPSYSLGSPSTSDEVLALLATVERIQLAAYLDAIPCLEPGTVRDAAVGFFANDAQHDSILRSLRGQAALPSAFVTGRG